MEPTFDDLIERLQQYFKDEESLPDEDQLVIYALRKHLGRDPLIEDFKKCIRYPHPGFPEGDYCLVYDLKKLGIIHFKENMEGVMLISFDDPVEKADSLSLEFEATPHSVSWNKFPTIQINFKMKEKKYLNSDGDFKY